MKLHWSPRSPFVRKVMITLAEKDLQSKVDCIPATVMMAGPANLDVLKDNPLGKIPALVLDDGRTVFDSRVICGYLDDIGSGARLIPDTIDARLACQRREALGDGLLDLLLLWRTELGRGGHANIAMCGGFEDKVRAAMAQLERDAEDLVAEPFGLGHISVVCALGQLDFRYPDCGWRDAHPKLAGWFESVSDRASVRDTMIRDDGSMQMGNIAMPLRFGDTQ